MLPLSLHLTLLRQSVSLNPEWVFSPRLAASRPRWSPVFLPHSTGVAGSLEVTPHHAHAASPVKHWTIFPAPDGYKFWGRRYSFSILFKYDSDTVMMSNIAAAWGSWAGLIEISSKRIIYSLIFKNSVSICRSGGSQSPGLKISSCLSLLITSATILDQQVNFEPLIPKQVHKIFQFSHWFHVELRFFLIVAIKY